jgi:hypothetical protein
VDDLGTIFSLLPMELKYVILLFLKSALSDRCSSDPDRFFYPLLLPRVDYLFSNLGELREARQIELSLREDVPRTWGEEQKEFPSDGEEEGEGVGQGKEGSARVGKRGRKMERGGKGKGEGEGEGQERSLYDIVYNLAGPKGIQEEVGEERREGEGEGMEVEGGSSERIGRDSQILQ